MTFWVKNKEDPLECKGTHHFKFTSNIQIFHPGSKLNCHVVGILWRAVFGSPQLYEMNHRVCAPCGCEHVDLFCDLKDSEAWSQWEQDNESLGALVDEDALIAKGNKFLTCPFVQCVASASSDFHFQLCSLNFNPVR